MKPDLLMEENRATPQGLLLPDRHPQNELFICDIADAVLKDIMPMMEHPFYSLSKKPDTKERVYEYNGNTIRIIPSSEGMPTIYDKDCLVYAISQLISAMRSGLKVSRKIQFSMHEALIFMNRGTSGTDYEALSRAFTRLLGVSITTNIKAGDYEQKDGFHLIEDFRIVKFGSNGRQLYCTMTLSDWVFKAIEQQAVLTLSPRYFRLRKPIERRLYELGRKHVGDKDKWKIGMLKLYEKSGSQGSLKRFRQAVKSICNDITKSKGKDGRAPGYFPDYDIEYIDLQDIVLFKSKGTVSSEPKFLFGGEIPLKPSTYTEARRLAPDEDVFSLEARWRQWSNKKSKPLSDPDAAFLGWIKALNN